ncbi:unnamed protein product, partial [Urochloa humidicola]
SGLAYVTVQNHCQFCLCLLSIWLNIVVSDEDDGHVPDSLFSSQVFITKKFCR